MRQRLLQQHAVAARHLALHRGRQCLLGAEPHQVEGVLPGAAVAGHRHHVGEGEGVLARVVGDPNRYEYTDPSLQNAEDDLDTLALYQDTLGGTDAVATKLAKEERRARAGLIAAR